MAGARAAATDDDAATDAAAVAASWLTWMFLKLFTTHRRKTIIHVYLL
jgi:hypothetical protein